MTTKGWYLIGMLVLLFLANMAMLLGMTNWPTRTREGFADAAAAVAAAKKPVAPKTAMEKFADMVAAKEEEKKDVAVGAAAGAGPATGTLEPFEDAPAMGAPAKKVASAPIVPVLGTGSTGVPAAAKEGFMDFLQGGFGTAPIGAYDGRNMAAGLPPAAQGFRANHPDEPLNGPMIRPSDDNQSGLFIFQNNQCKPECCGSTLACDGGCVCTSVSDRNFINSRGGNRLSGDI